jgi:endogenous inhibitor of DNA gyrase (YacG/DUF329 family)
MEQGQHSHTWLRKRALGAPKQRCATCGEEQMWPAHAYRPGPHRRQALTPKPELSPCAECQASADDPIHQP